MKKTYQKNALLTVVVPLYNEERSLPTVLLSLVPYCRKHKWKLILVNDGSTDGTRKILDMYENKPWIHIMHHKVNRGYGGALKTGILEADTPYLVTIDGDDQHAPEDIERVFNFALENDADLVVGNRGRWHETSAYRELGKWTIRKFTRLLMPLPIHDLNSGFKLYRSDLAKKYIHLCPNSMAFSDIITLIFINQRDLVLEHPITVKKRETGKSTISTYTAFDTVMEIINLALLFNPLRIFLPLAIACILFGFAWGTPFLLMERGVSIGAMLAIVTGLLFFAIGLIASQLSAIRTSLLNRE